VAEARAHAVIAGLGIALELAVKSRLVHVVAIFDGISRVVTIAAIFQIDGVERVGCVLASGQEVPATTFATIQAERFPDRMCANLPLKLREDLLLLRERPKIDLMHPPFVFLLRELFIPDAILLVTEIPAPKTVAASDTVEEERRVTTVVCQRDECAVIVAVRVQTLITHFAAGHLVTVTDIAASQNPLRVVHIFRTRSDANSHVGIAQSVAVIAVLAVLRILLKERHAGNGPTKFLVLFEERTMEVERPAT
jgi:hypothetical protein